jgi:hypothetical protein
MKQKLFAHKSRNCFYEAKTPRFCFIVAEKWFDAKKTASIWISPETSPETSEQFFVLLKHHNNFFSGEVILPETSPETSEQKNCTNVASEQNKNRQSPPSDCYGANLESKCSKKFILMMQKYRSKVATKIFYYSIVEKKTLTRFSDEPLLVAALPTCHFHQHQGWSLRQHQSQSMRSQHRRGGDDFKHLRPRLAAPAAALTPRPCLAATSRSCS